MNEQKCVIIINEALPLGILANAAAILGITIGKQFPHYVGEAVMDKNNQEHPGITTFPIPILKANEEQLKIIREKLYDDKFSSIFVVDFTDVAQSCISYEEYIRKISSTMSCDLNYFGIGCCGDKKLVNKLTGNLPLLR